MNTAIVRKTELITSDEIRISEGIVPDDSVYFLEAFGGHTKGELNTLSEGWFILDDDLDDGSYAVCDSAEKLIGPSSILQPGDIILDPDRLPVEIPETYILTSGSVDVLPPEPVRGIGDAYRFIKRQMIYEPPRKYYPSGGAGASGGWTEVDPADGYPPINIGNEHESTISASLYHQYNRYIFK